MLFQLKKHYLNRNNLNFEFFFYYFLNRDYQQKRDALQIVKRKIQERNPDEFYFNMVNTEIKV